MNVQGFGGAAALYASMRSMASVAAPQSQAAQAQVSGLPSSGTQLTISDQAKALSAGDQDTQAKLAEITAKDPNTRTAEDINAMQKAGGFVNTFANLSPSEMKLYDDLVAKGDTAAAEGLSMIALTRMGDRVDIPNGMSFDPQKTAITPEHIRDLFSRAFASPDKSQTDAFESLARYLKANPAG